MKKAPRTTEKTLVFVAVGLAFLAIVIHFARILLKPW